MKRRFRGESIHKVDAKGRVSVPAPFRRVLEEGDPDWTDGLNPTFALIYGSPTTGCVEGYPIRSIAEIDDAIAALPRFSAERKRLERMLNSKSDYAQIDETGRMLLPAALRERIGVSSEALFAGMGEKFEIWAPDAYRADEAAGAEALAGREDELFALLDRGAIIDRGGA